MTCFFLLLRNMEMYIAEILGYLASIFVIASFLMKNISMIRLVNAGGCILFILYGVFKGMLWPIIIPNAVLLTIQIYYVFLNKETKVK